MKYGRSLNDVAAEITRQTEAKKDYLAPTTDLAIAIERQPDKKPRIMLGIGQEGLFPLRDLALQQIGEERGVPIKYLRRMEDEAPDLLATNLNHWLLRHGEQKRRMVRTLDGSVRAYLSDAYQRTDHFDVASTVLPILKERNLEVVSCDITETRLYIKAIDTSLQLPVVSSRRVGDLVEAGVIISNSEVGLGSTAVSPFARYLACFNGAIRDGGARWNHVGKRALETNGAVVFADDTRSADDRATLLVIRDTLKSAMDPNVFHAYINKVNGTTSNQITGDVAKGIEVLANNIGLNKAEQASILRHLVEGGDLSQYGVFNAVTQTAEDAESYDRATELEMLGGRVIDLAPREWRQVAEAA